MAATQTREAAPIMSLGSQMQSAGQPMAAPLVTKDELIEGSNINMSAQDQSASHNAVMATLNKIKGSKPQQESSPPLMSTPSPFVNPPPSQPMSSFGAMSSLSMPSMSVSDSSSQKSNAV